MGNANSQTINKENALAWRWLTLAGTVAICFSLFLVWVDEYLSNSTAEIEKAATIAEMRTAQSLVGDGKIDPRQRQDLPEHNSAGISRKKTVSDH
ncbi:MAG TPA: hypothetical protein PKD37_02150 [Oligoflexia bacterium]|nr:hypothetical protein [Oligoflexia bacterium]HMP26773.1 hypothetical protein [Oligoflexia bacterium]